MKIRTDELLALLCKALSERYPDDPTTPGVQIAHLPAGKDGRKEATWYVACHRYTGSFGAGRTVAAKKTGDDLDRVLAKLAKSIADDTPKVSAQRELKRAVAHVPAEEIKSFASRLPGTPFFGSDPSL